MSATYFVCTCLLTLAPLALAGGDPGEVEREQKISSTQGGFGGLLTQFNDFGHAVTALGDLDGNGVTDIAVGAPFDNDGGTSNGAVWILFMKADGTVASEAKISDVSGGFKGRLDSSDRFGQSVAALGDFDGDGVVDLAVGASLDDDGNPGFSNADRGAVWLLMLKPDGSVKTQSKISDTSGGFTGRLSDGDAFGDALAVLGDLDGDGVVDLAVGARGDDHAGIGTGAVWVLRLAADGTVKASTRIASDSGGFVGSLGLSGQFGNAVCALGDLDADGVQDLTVGAWLAGAPGYGEVWVLFLRTDGTVRAQQKITSGVGGFTGALDDGDRFGTSVAGLGDLDGDGVLDLAVGANGDDDGATPPSGSNPPGFTGALWLLFLRADGTVRAHTKISATSGGFTGPLQDYDFFATSVGFLGDLDGDGVGDLLVGEPRDDDGATTFPPEEGDLGAVWVLFLDAAVWSDLGFGLPGTHGVPVHTASGTMAEGSAERFALQGALEGAPAVLVLGNSLAGVPFLGGVLVPFPDVVLMGLSVQADAELAVRVPWPDNLPCDSSVWSQFWIHDPLGPQGFAASNAVVGTSP